jgi:cytochrome bd-type quinol oxidase subunit 2
MWPTTSQEDWIMAEVRVAKWWRSSWARFGFVFIGVAFGAGVSLTSPSRGTEPWLVWAALAISLTAVSGAVFGYGLTQWPEIVASHSTSSSPLTEHRESEPGRPRMMFTIMTPASAGPGPPGQGCGGLGLELKLKLPSSSLR